MALAEDDDTESTLRAAVHEHRDAICDAVARHHGRRARLIGSVARGDDRPDSDIDLLIDFDPDSSLFDLIRLTRELQQLLGCPVDVVSTGGLKERDRGIEAGAVDL